MWCCWRMAEFDEKTAFLLSDASDQDSATDSSDVSEQTSADIDHDIKDQTATNSAATVATAPPPTRSVYDEVRHLTFPHPLTDGNQRTTRVVMAQPVRATRWEKRYNLDDYKNEIRCLQVLSGLTVCFCIPLGIIAAIFTAMAKDAASHNKDPRFYMKSAVITSIIGIVVGAGITVGYIIFRVHNIKKQTSQ
ncbi:uncharacterized protein [Dysidea avara]|uniref:uncharacterized protein n=1 Tax=Dysidea avara TaxID=196820 RepID=UPI003324D7C1